ncbi:MAG: 3-deoxy-manno-octulosonate cytidylyltransferase [Acidobacteria bacterium]|nr:3-deoxy-manno-octulosonate cytidylyltransferase [Acidobacteriota bacterium]
MTEPSVVAIIPARFHSTRLPAKILADIAGRPMIEHVYMRAAAARTVSAVIVATDDQRIERVVHGFGGHAAMTRADHLSGTDRLAEVAATLTCDIVVNVQGDEPLLDPSVIDAVVAPMLADPTLPMATACRPVRDIHEFTSPGAVKVVRDEGGRAMYFSRAPVPFPRDAQATVPDEARIHVGLYAYRRAALLALAALPPAAAERTESLEQLRALANGLAIQVVETTHQSFGVDTAADLERVRQLLHVSRS